VVNYIVQYILLPVALFVCHHLCLSLSCRTVNANGLAVGLYRGGQHLIPPTFGVCGRSEMFCLLNDAFGSMNKAYQKPQVARC
jgi:hypothetical protein